MIGVLWKKVDNWALLLTALGWNLKSGTWTNFIDGVQTVCVLFKTFITEKHKYNIHFFSTQTCSFFLHPSFGIYNISGDLNRYFCLLPPWNQTNDVVLVFVFLLSIAIQGSHFNVRIVFRWRRFVVDLDSSVLVWSLVANWSTLNYWLWCKIFKLHYPLWSQSRQHLGNSVSSSERKLVLNQPYIKGLVKMEVMAIPWQMPRIK